MVFFWGVHSVAPSFALDQDIGQSGLLSVGKASDAEMGSSQVDTAVRLLHRAARSFSSSIKRCVMTRSSPELANAWVGVDVHAWQRHIAYQAAVYALLMTVIEARFTSCDEERNDPSKVHIVLSPKLNLLLDSIETQLNTRNPKLVTWFKMVKLPNLARYFIPLFKKWSSEYGRSGIAEVIHSICFCVAVDKLAERVSCPRFTLSIPEIMGELMDLSYNLVSMDRLHSLASEAGVEQEFLAYFGSKVLPNKESREVAFWIGLVHKRLCVAFRRESFISSREGFSNRKNLERDLATLGLFAFLGRRTRLFLLGMGMKDLDEQLNNFISYLECGSLFIYAELSSLPVYQLFMEIVAEEMEWLDFYAAIPGISLNERKRSKQHPIQAEKEIILSAVYCVCSDVFSGFSHFSSSTQQSLDENVVTFLLRSKNLLTMCLEDYLAAYYRSGYVRFCSIIFLSV
ncbi:hypothetical protein GIB67_025307 [Kingdonia uniflora]|uniref:Uncharacterized protein n=1 Tax=Kingdonia uniflora TaxID=39325 RepID=A0A7J7NB58_9MAGN|nr:hypothetical protein GIB67_025307 [Kingdonia uniflora]